MDFDKLFDIVEEKEGEYLDFLKEVVEIESPTSYKHGVDTVSKYLIDKAKEKGWKIDVYPQKIAGDFVVITMNNDVKNKPICLSGHVDTVHPVGSFRNNWQIIGNKIIGPGVTDCKGGCVCAFWVMDALLQMNYTKRPIMLLLQSDEETGSVESNKETVRCMVEKSKNAEAFLNLEPSTAGGVTLERKGIATFEITVTGLSQHASVCYFGANAIAEAANKILKLEQYKEKDGITFNCGKIHGGTVSNVVPERCVFVLDARFKTVEEYEKIKDIVKVVAEEKCIENTSCEVKEIYMRDCMPYSDANHELFRKLNTILKKAGLEELKNINDVGGSDAAYVTLAGIPTVDSLGVIGGGMHSSNEYMEIEKFTVTAKRLAAIIADI